MKTKWGFFALFISLVVILMMVSSTDVVTLFSGTHQLVNITASGNDIDCVPCHQWVRDELDNAAIHSTMDCEDCHRYEGTGIDFAEHNQVGNEAHAAYIPRCLDCHGAGGAAPQATAFNESDYGTDYSAHKEFVQDALNCDLSVGENEACLACHTNYSVTIDYSYFWDISYSAVGDSSEQNITEFTYNGTRNYNLVYSKTGAKHEFLNMTVVREESCLECHKNIYDALVYGAGEGDYDDDYLTHAPIEIDNQMWTDTDNAWEHARYHYWANRPNINNYKYCSRCHNVNYFASTHPAKKTTYSLDDVTDDTNSTLVHAAEMLTCATCHGSGKTKEVIDNGDMPGTGHYQTDPDLVDLIAERYARTFNGDICMGCHEGAIHPNSGGCGKCHNVPPGVDRDVYIESEPSGYCVNTAG
jgi:hypothetical protein